MDGFLEFFSGFFGGATIATAVIAVMGFLGRSLLQNLLNKDLEEFKSRLRDSVELKRIVTKYSGVILLAASDLQDRLWHLCQRESQSKNPVLLAKDEDVPMYEVWPMTKEHYLSSTLYLFARYLCWVEILRLNIRFLDFGNDEKTNEFNYHLKRIERILAETDMQKFVISVSKDRPLFQLMQTEIGETLIIERNGERECMAFRAFLVVFDKQLETSIGFSSLHELIHSSVAGKKNDFCLSRLRLMTNALVDLIKFLNEEHKLISIERIEEVPIPDFNLIDYKKKWPSSFGHKEQKGFVNKMLCTLFFNKPKSS